MPAEKKGSLMQQEAGVLLNRDANAAIQFLVGLGEVEALSPDVIPALKNLRPETLIDLQIDSLLARKERYEKWRDEKLEGEKTGLPTPGNESHKSNLDKTSEALIGETVRQIEELAQKRLELMTPQK